MMTKNLILLQKRLMQVDSNISIENPSTVSNLAMAMSVNHQLMKYGFTLSSKAFDHLTMCDAADIKDFHDEVIQYLKEMSGSTRNFKSLYGNFPSGILSLTETQKWYYQMLHYWSDGKFNIEIENPEPTIFQEIDYTVIELASNQDVINIYVRLAETGQALTPSDCETLKWFGKQSEFKLPAVDIKFKENMATLFGLIPTLQVKTVTDVLRIATVISGGDAALLALPKNQKKRKEVAKFNFPETKCLRLLDLFENSNLDVREMNTTSRYGRFIRLAEALHVGKHKNQFPKTANAFYILRNQTRKGNKTEIPKVRTWNYEVNQAFNKSFETGLRKLSERPGEFVRRLDSLVRNNTTNLDGIMAALANCKPSNKVLYEVFTHFENRRTSNARQVFIKGARKPTPLPILKPLLPKIIDGIQNTILDIIKSKFTDLDPMAETYLDPELKKIPLPTNMRTLSKSMTPVIRGQRTPIPTTSDMVRCYVHWYNDGTRREGTDIDLSAFLVEDNKVEQIGWNARGKTSYALYSGDVTSKSGACAEYIDIDIPTAVKDGWKYMLIDIRDYRGGQGGFSTYKDCVAGFNSITVLSSSTSWKPESLTNSVQITSTATAVQLLILDLTIREYIWLDVDSTGNVGSRDVRTVLANITKYSEPPKISVYDLLEWHVIARGGRLVNAEDTETQFLFNDFSTDYSNILPWMGV